MELFFGLIIFCIFLMLIAVFGHGLWVMFSYLFRLFYTDLVPIRPEVKIPGRRFCPRCGCGFRFDLPACPQCGLDPEGATADELRELEITVHYLQRLVQEGTLDPAAGEEVYRSLEARQTSLLNNTPAAKAEPEAPKTIPIPALPPRFREPTLPWVLRLEKLLALAPDVRDLSLANRQLALSWYKQLPEAELPKLPAQGLLGLARLTRIAGLASRSLHLYELLRQTYPQSPQILPALIEGADLSCNQRNYDLARDYINQAITHPLTPEQLIQVQYLQVHLSSKPSQVPMVLEEAPLPVAVAVEVAEEGQPIPARQLGPAQPRPTWGQLFGHFLEEKNILWGELVGGLLIVGCSIALVISLWRTLEAIPYFPFIIFAAITASLFAAGIYTLNHWKLEATSRGLLVIATLLTPLDFLVLIGLWREQEAGWWDWSLSTVAVVFFSWFVARSGQVLVRPLIQGWRRADWLLAVGVVGVSACLLPAPAWLDPEYSATLWQRLVLSYGPILCASMALGLTLSGWRQGMANADRKAKATFLFLGQTMFALAMAFGLLLYSSPVLMSALAGLALPITLAGLAWLFTGTLVQRRMDLEVILQPTLERGLTPGMARWLAACLSLAGMAIMVGGQALAWPGVVGLVGLGLLNCLVLSLVALRERLTFAHFPALMSMALALIVGFHGMANDIPMADGGPWLLTRIQDSSTGIPLAVLALILAVTTEWLTRRDRLVDAGIHLMFAGLAAIFALGMVGVTWVAEPARATIIFTTLGLATLLANVRWRLPEISFSGGMLLFLAMYFGLNWHDPMISPTHGLVFLFLTFATLALASALLIFWLTPEGGQRGLRESHGQPLLKLSFAATFLNVIPFTLSLDWPWLPMATVCLVWLIVLWMIMAWRLQMPSLALATQLVSIVAVILGVTAWLCDQPWVERRVVDLFHPRTLQIYGLSLISWCWAILAIKKVLRRFQSGRLQFPVGHISIERVMIGILLAGSIALVLPGLGQGVVQELQAPGFGLLVALPIDFGMAWAGLVLLGLTLSLGLVSRINWLAILGLMGLVLNAVMVGCLLFEDQRAVASALRWGLAMSFLGLSFLAWIRSGLEMATHPLGLRVENPEGLVQTYRRLLVIFALVPVIDLTVWGLALRMTGIVPAGPTIESLFGQIGSLWSRVIPLALGVLGLLGYAWREKMAGYFFSAGALLTGVVAGGLALKTFLEQGLISDVDAIYLVQIGLMVHGGWSLLWLGSGNWRHPDFLPVQIAIGIVLALGLLIPGLSEILLRPERPLDQPLLQMGQWSGWLALIFNGSAGLIWVRQERPVSQIHMTSGFLVALVGLASIWIASQGTTSWGGYHLLTVGWTLVGLGLMAASWVGSAATGLGPKYWPSEQRATLAASLRTWLPPGTTRRHVEALAIIVIFLAFRGVWQAPTRPVWSLGALVAVSLLLGGLAIWARRPGYVYASGLLLNLFAYALWQAWTARQIDELPWWPFRPSFLLPFLFLQIIALGLGATAWSIVDGHLRGLAKPIDVRGAIIPYPHAAFLLAIQLLALIILSMVLAQLFQSQPEAHQLLAWFAWLAVAVGVTCSLWDAEASIWGLPGCPAYVLGLLVFTLVLVDLGLVGIQMAWAGALAGAGYLSLTAALATHSSIGANWTARLGLPSREAARLQFWFVPAQVVLGCGIVALSLWLSLALEFLPQRLTGPAAVFLLAITVLILASGWPKLMVNKPWPGLRSIEWPRQTALWLLVLFVLETGWALIDPASYAAWLHRAVMALTGMLIMAAVLASGCGGRFARGSPWGDTCQRVARRLALGATLQLALVLILEFAWYDPVLRKAPLVAVEIALVACLLGLATVVLIGLAISPRLASLGWSTKKRERLVYAAEVMVILLLVHLRLSIPELSLGLLARFWPMAVMTLAFGGVGLASWCRRKGLAVIADPLERTSLVLPLLPLAAYLLRPLAELQDLGDQIPGLNPFFRSLRGMPHEFQVHALLWVLLGGLYTWVAIMRRSTKWAILAALAANFGLWVILANVNGMGFLLHPQIWLAPLGLIILAAEHFHRPSLTPTQGKTIRHAGLLTIYLSSSADMFIAGLGQSWWPPVVLALFAIVGVFAGILLRVRGFLVMGIAFLFLVIFAQIWHAAVDRAHTWLWWVCGIVLGVAILILFALFEKRKNDVVKVLEELKRWR